MVGKYNNAAFDQYNPSADLLWNSYSPPPAIRTLTGWCKSQPQKTTTRQKWRVLYEVKNMAKKYYKPQFENRNKPVANATNRPRETVVVVGGYGGNTNGSSAISTATITFINNTSSNVQLAYVDGAYEEETGYFINAGITVLANRENAVSVMMVPKNDEEAGLDNYTCATFNTHGISAAIATSGSIEEMVIEGEPTGVYIVTGDCTVTFS